MGAKQYAAAALAGIVLAAPGCAGFKRLAPPGLLKYEDLAGDQPVNPAIEARIAERRREIDSRFPNLSEQPSMAPETTPAAELEAQSAALNEAREALEAAVAADRAAAEAEREEALRQRADDMASQIIIDEEEARRERREPMPARPVEQ